MIVYKFITTESSDEVFKKLSHVTTPKRDQDNKAGSVVLFVHHAHALNGDTTVLVDDSITLNQTTELENILSVYAPFTKFSAVQYEVAGHRLHKRVKTTIKFKKPKVTEEGVIIPEKVKIKPDEGFIKINIDGVEGDEVELTSYEEKTVEVEGYQY